MTSPNFFNVVLIWPIINVLLGIYHVVFSLHIPYALGFSIILITLLVRLVLAPFTAAQIKASSKMQKIAPHLNRLKEKHKNDAKMLQAETMKLYKEHGVNPAAGCLPVIIQLPLIWAFYSVLQHVVSTKPAAMLTQLNSIAYFPWLKLQQPWNTTFFGLPLGESPSKLMATAGVLMLLFPIATAFFQFIQSKMMFTKQPSLPEESNKNQKQLTDGKNEKPKQDDFSSAMQTQSMYIFPLMIGFFSFSLPLGLSLYWNTFTIFGIIQQYKLQGWGGMQDWINKLKRK